MKFQVALTPKAAAIVRAGMKRNKRSGCAEASWIIEAARFKSLLENTEVLMQIVEGCRGQRWAVAGNRLVDTPEWCAFYAAHAAVMREIESQ